jgi:hypothetical protein
MSSFWPVGLEISDTQSPRDILSTAQEEWQTNSNGILELVLQDAESESGNSMIIVHAKHAANNRTATLFSIVHQPDKPYPVRIQPEEEDLPSFLKRSSKPNSLMTLGSSIMMPDEWVSDTPSEFRKKLTEVFNLGIIKREILNLASITTDKVNNTNEDLAEEDV